MIKDLRSLKSYNGNGILPISINYSTIFGHNPPQQCVGGPARAEDRVCPDVAQARVRGRSAWHVDRRLVLAHKVPRHVPRALIVCVRTPTPES